MIRRFTANQSLQQILCSEKGLLYPPGVDYSVIFLIIFLTKNSNRVLNFSMFPLNVSCHYGLTFAQLCSYQVPLHKAFDETGGSKPDLCWSLHCKYLLKQPQIKHTWRFETFELNTHYNISTSDFIMV